MNSTLRRLFFWLYITAVGVFVFVAVRAGQTKAIGVGLAIGFVLLGLSFGLTRHAHSNGESVSAFLTQKLRESYRNWNNPLDFDDKPERDSLALLRSLQCPKWAGSVTAKKAAEGPTRAVVVCIQDLYANIEVQRHIREIIGYLVNVHGFRHLFVEGASGAGDLQLLSSLPPLVRWAFMEMLMKKAYLTGSEYAGASRPEWDFELWGVDDPDLYRSNFRPAEGIEVLRDQVLRAADTFRQRIIQACAPLASRELSEFLAIVTRRRTNRFATIVSDHLRYLLLYTSSYSITVPSRLRPFLPELVQDFRLPTPDGARIGPTEAEADIQALENEIIAAIAKASGNPVDSCYQLLLNTVDLAARAFQLGLQSDEARDFFTFDVHGLERRLADAIDRVNSLLQPGDARLEMPEDFRVVITNWTLPQAFYRTALARSDAMLTNVASQVKQRRIDRAIFVSGGFHSDYVAAQLAHRHGIGSVIITPTVDKLDQEQAYRRRMREDLRSQPMGAEPLDIGQQNVLPALAMAVTKLHGYISQALTGFYRRAVFERVKEFAISGPRLKGNEAIVELECHNSNILPSLSYRVTDGVAIGIDQFGYFLGGNEINLLDAESYVARVLRTARRSAVQILNMNPRFLYFKDASLEWVVSLELDRIKRVADRGEAIREAVRVLKGGGTLLLLAGKRCNEYARLLLRLGMSDITRLELFPYIARGHFIAARKPGATSVESAFAWVPGRRFVAGKNRSGRPAWIRVSDK